MPPCDPYEGETEVSNEADIIEDLARVGALHRRGVAAKTNDTDRMVGDALYRKVVAPLLAEAERRGAEKGGRQIAFEIRQTFADPTRERPLRPDAECRTDLADDPEWCAMIADRYSDEHRAGADQ